MSESERVDARAALSDVADQEPRQAGGHAYDAVSERIRFRARGSYAGVGLTESRTFLDRARRPGGPSVAHIADVVVPVDPPVRARVYHPEPGNFRPILVWTHGGGWCLGGLDTTDEVCRHLTQSGWAILSIDHRRAPEHPYPAPLDDVAAVADWVTDHAAEIGGAAGRVALGGESSGANLALAAAARLRDRHGADLARRIQHLLLVVPVADLSPRPSMRADQDPGLSVADLEWFMDRYLPSPALRYDQRVFPNQTASLAGLPASTIATAGLDPLRDGALALVDQLRRADVAVQHLDQPSAGHGLLGDLAGSAPGAALIGEIIERLDRVRTSWTSGINE